MKPGPASALALRRIVGVTTIACVGVGAAIGSGIFRAPGEIAELVASPWIILGLWIAAGVITLMQCLVTAELATRFPRAGGEYHYLKEAYGEFAAFFFGWSFTIFIIGGGGGTIARQLGDLTASLLQLPPKWATPLFGCASVMAVVGVNCLGLRAGAAAQNALTILKVLAVLGIAAGAMIVASRWSPATAAEAPVNSAASGAPSISVLLSALLLAFWPYTGATDPAKLAEETRDVRRAMPIALIATVLLLAAIYLFYNYALLCAMSPAQMAGKSDVHAIVFGGIGGRRVEVLILLASILICLGALSSVFLANTRVTFALARDGLTFRLLAWMSPSQAPIPSLIFCGVIACGFVLNRRFSEILRIYFMGSTVLFGLAYLSLVVFRMRDRRAGSPFPKSAFRAPCGILMALLLTLLEAAIAGVLLWEDVRSWFLPPEQRRYDSVLTLAALAGFAAMYFAWKRAARPSLRRTPPPRL
ncbi:MAG TPA: amino acid permease [Phycisphaerae bacterium]|nr:amino acid permease [Phycisphaerae bacterium]